MSVKDLTKTQYGEMISKLANDTLNELHTLIRDATKKEGGQNGLMNYMLNESMIFLAFVEQLIAIYKIKTALAFNAVMKKNDS